MEIDAHKKQFGNQAENYTKYRKPYTEELYKLLFSVASGENKKILDVACGTGKSTEPLVRNGNNVFGCDHDPLMIAEARKQALEKKLAIEYKVGEVEHLPYGDEQFDIVVVGTAFHWFVNETSLSEIKRVLKKDGLVFIFWTLTTKDIPEEDEIPPSIFRSFNWEKVPTELRDLAYISNFLKENGLKDVSTARIPFVDEDTVDDRVGLQTTASAYGLLSTENKKKFLEEVKDVLTKKLGDRPYFSMEAEVQVCYAWK